ncbi:MAG: hypothetical protein LBH80_06125, partial [Prevotellaceae bacterium]|nr:hypothetical protein [Prevotellaceae bacterium]
MKRLFLFLSVCLCCFFCNAQNTRKGGSLEEIKGVWKSDLIELNSQKPYWVLKISSDVAVNEYIVSLQKNSYYYDRKITEKKINIYAKGDSIQFSFIELDSQPSDIDANRFSSLISEYHLSGLQEDIGSYILTRLNESDSRNNMVIVHDFILYPEKKQLIGTHIVSEIMLTDQSNYVINKQHEYDGLFEKGTEFMNDIFSLWGITWGAQANDFSSINDY